MKIISLTLFFIVRVAFANEMTLLQAVDKKVSLELSLALEQIQLVANIKGSQTSIDEINRLIKRLDSNLVPLDLAESLFLQKTEFYKHFLQSDYKVETYQIDKILELTNKMIGKGMNEYSPLTRWFILGIIDDLKQMKFEKAANPKKIKILIPWLSAFLNDERNQFEERVYNSGMGYISNLINILELYSSLNRYDIKSDSQNLFHFQTKKIELNTSSKDLTTIIDNTLEQLNNPRTEKNTKKPSKKTLPIPLDDWVFDF